MDSLEKIHLRWKHEESSASCQIVTIRQGLRAGAAADEREQFTGEALEPFVSVASIIGAIRAPISLPQYLIGKVEKDLPVAK